MISLALARQLNGAGLHWEPAVGDQFSVADVGLDDKVFVISEQTAFLQNIHGKPLITFHGNPEWALDHVAPGDVVWLPTETQLRLLIAERLPLDAELRLSRSNDGYTCTIGLRGNRQSFTATEGEDAYGMALLALLASAN